MANLGLLAGAAGMGEGLVRGVSLGMEIDESRQRKDQRRIENARMARQDTQAAEDRTREIARQKRADERAEKQFQVMLDANDLDQKVKALQLDEAQQAGLKRDIAATLAKLSVRESGDGSMLSRTMMDPLDPQTQKKLSAFTGMHVTNAGVWYEEGKSPEQANIHIVGIDGDGDARTIKLPWAGVRDWATGRTAGRLKTVPAGASLVDSVTGEIVTTAPGATKPGASQAEAGKQLVTARSELAKRSAVLQSAANAFNQKPSKENRAAMDAAETAVRAAQRQVEALSKMAAPSSMAGAAGEAAGEPAAATEGTALPALDELPENLQKALEEGRQIRDADGNVLELDEDGNLRLVE